MELKDIYLSSSKGEYKFLNSFFVRYLAGGSSLDEFRSISRRNLALVDVVGAHEYAHAMALKQQIDRFQEAARLIKTSKQFSIELFCDVNKKLTPEHKHSGFVRTTQNWVGKSLERATYVPPPPSELDTLLSDLTAILNSEEFSTDEKAVIAFVNISQIHPFADGNGRVARALYSGILAKDHDVHVPLSLYRFKSSQEHYHNFLQEQSINSKQPINHSYLDKAHQWIKRYEQEVYKQLAKTQKAISNKIGFSNMSREAMKIVTILWQYPVMTYSKIASYFSNNVNVTNDVISKLSNCSLIATRKISYQSTLIYVAEDILICWETLDNLISEVK